MYKTRLLKFIICNYFSAHVFFFRAEKENVLHSATISSTKNFPFPPPQKKSNQYENEYLKKLEKCEENRCSGVNLSSEYVRTTNTMRVEKLMEKMVLSAGQIKDMEQSSR